MRACNFTLRDDNDARLPVRVEASGHGLHLMPEGYSNPVSLDWWQGRLRVLINADIREEEPQIIDLEGAKLGGPSQVTTEISLRLSYDDTPDNRAKIAEFRLLTQLSEFLRRHLPQSLNAGIALGIVEDTEGAK